MATGTFHDCFHIARFANAQFFARELFVASFRQPFPVPRDHCGLPIPTPPENWRQYVAFYKWPDGRIETVGFCNWIRYGDVYLEGGMCVDRTFYRRLPREHWLACKAHGGVAQLMMEAAAAELDDCAAWFGYCGDKKAYIVDARIGYRPTSREHLIVKWFRDVPPGEQQALEEKVGAIGPF
jgi:hypothetical protein